MAEVLAYHYSQTDQTAKAFLYLSMAGHKGLGIYSLEEATNHFAAALAVLDKNPNCASDDQVADFFVDYTSSRDIYRALIAWAMIRESF